jgi:zeta-carotene desaturase
VNADVIVVGAGFAGLSAASALAERGVRVLLLEARPTLGGRATAFDDPGTGERVDNGQHVLFGCYRETFRFLERIGARAHVRLETQLSLDIIDGDGRRSRLVCPPLPGPFHLVAGMMAWEPLTWRDRVAVLNLRTLDDPAKGETVREWLVRKRQTPRLIELLWEPLAVAGLNESIDRASAAPFVTLLQRLFSGGPQNAAIAMPVKPLDEMYAVPARAYVEQRGGVIKVSSRATIDCEGQPYAGSAFRRTMSDALEVIAGGERFRARAVICAVPWHALSDVFPARPAALSETLAAADGTAASPIVTVNLWFDRVVADRTLVGLPGRTLQWMFDKRAVFGEEASHLSMIASGADAVIGQSNQDLTDLAMRELSAALPRVRDANLRRAVVVRERRATFSVAPGQPSRPATRTRVPGLFLAGDWIDTGLPATIEGAVISGHRAADAALQIVKPSSRP